MVLNKSYYRDGELIEKKELILKNYFSYNFWVDILSLYCIFESHPFGLRIFKSLYLVKMIDFYDI